MLVENSDVSPCGSVAVAVNTSPALTPLMATRAWPGPAGRNGGPAARLAKMELRVMVIPNDGGMAGFGSLATSTPSGLLAITLPGPIVTCWALVVTWTPKTALGTADVPLAPTPI